MALLLCGAAHAATPLPVDEGGLDANLRGWSGPDGQSGHQLFLPLSAAIAIPSKDLEIDLTLKSGFAAAYYEGYGVDGSVRTWTDTVVGLNFGVPGALDTPQLRLFLLVDVNLPTGKATLRGDEKLALMDPDLADLVRYGEGLNVNLGAGASYVLAPGWVATLAAGYNLRGSYVPDGDTGLEYDPGDQWTLLGTLDYTQDALAATLSVKYTGETMGTLDGFDYFDPGDNLEASLRLGYAIDPASAIQLSLAYARSERNRYLNFFTGEVEPEAANGNGPVWAATLIYSRALDEGLVGSLYASWKRRSANDFDPVNDLFIPARTQWSVGASLEQDLGPDLALTIGASAGRLTDEATIFTETTQRTDTWSISAGLSAAF